MKRNANFADSYIITCNKSDNNIIYLFENTFKSKIILI